MQFFLVLVLLRKIFRNAHKNPFFHSVLDVADGCDCKIVLFKFVPWSTGTSDFLAVGCELGASNLEGGGGVRVVWWWGGWWVVGEGGFLIVFFYLVIFLMVV